MAKKLLKNLLLVSVLSVSAVLTSCSSVNAKPGNIKDPIVGVEGDKEYFRNTIETIYDNLVESGTTNTTVFDELVVNIAKEEVLAKGFVTDEKVLEICQEILLKEVKGGSYSTDNLFDEKKYVSALKATNPGISFGDNETYNQNYLIMPEDEFEDVFKADYKEYIEKKIKPGVLKSLLTAKYLCENSISSLSRASARQVQYIKLPNFANKSGEVNKLINEWLGNYISNPTETIDLDELQAIYKGIKQDTNGLESAELEKANRINDYISRYYTLANEITEDLDKIVVKDDEGKFKKENGKFVMKNSDDTDQTIEDKYTGSGAYTIEWGVELAQRNLLQKDFTGEDIFTKSKGIADLPSELTDRLFSASISSYVETSDKTVAGNDKSHGVSFLTPKTLLNGSEFGKYYSYDSASDAYTIVVVNEYFTSSVVNQLIKDNTKDGKITYVEDLVDIAYTLAESTTNQRLSLVHYLQKYNIGSNIHDEKFYEYIVDNYVEIIK